MAPSRDVCLRPRTHPLREEEKQSILLLAASLPSQANLSETQPPGDFLPEPERTMREHVDSASYLFPFPLPMSRLGGFLLRLLTHLSLEQVS